WLAAWTVGVMAFVHSRNWSGAFPADNVLDARDESLTLGAAGANHERPALHDDADAAGVRADSSGRAAASRHRLDTDGNCAHAPCSSSHHARESACGKAAGCKAA